MLHWKDNRAWGFCAWGSAEFKRVDDHQLRITSHWLASTSLGSECWDGIFPLSFNLENSVSLREKNEMSFDGYLKWEASEMLRGRRMSHILVWHLKQITELPECASTGLGGGGWRPWRSFCRSFFKQLGWDKIHTPHNSLISVYCSVVFSIFTEFFIHLHNSF